MPQETKGNKGGNFFQRGIFVFQFQFSEVRNMAVSDGFLIILFYRAQPKPTVDR